MDTAYYEEIERKIQNYKTASSKLISLKIRLENVSKSLKELRKSRDIGVNPQIQALNKEHGCLKEEISELKKFTAKEYESTEKLIFDGIYKKYSDIFDVQLSRLYGYKVSIIVKNIGDDFDEKTCLSDFMIITKDKKQHGKIIRMLDFGIIENEDNFVVKKARVEMCVYSKKYTAGTVVPYDFELLEYR